MDRTDTIAAISTAPGEGGIAIVRMSGPRAGEILKQAFQPARGGARISSHRMRYGAVLSESGEMLDEVMAVFMQSPNTYTREDVAEIYCHGGAACARSVVRRLLSLGARAAQPGEFTRRAYENGRIDLSRAEAVMQLVGAKSEAARRAAVAQMRGGVASFVEETVGRIEHMLSSIQAAVDFPDEVDEQAVAEEVRLELEKLAGQIEKKADPAAARVVREGASVVIAGRPNAGKSSLMNALLQFERAIVTDIPGTTRDVLTERFEIGGCSVRLCDTAGLRKSGDAIEAIGVERAMAEIEQADVVLLVLDQSREICEEELALLARADDRYVLCLNKADLPSRFDQSALLAREAVSLCARTGEGVERVVSIVEQKLRARAGEESFFTVERQMSLAREAASCLRASASALAEGFSPDVIAPDLLRACALLDGVTGRDAAEEVIDNIFARFCVGK